MFNIGEYVLHQKTGNISKVISYRRRMPSDDYTTTLKVGTDQALDFNRRGIVEEDLPSAGGKW
jgi:hypothetical protein